MGRINKEGEGASYGGREMCFRARSRHLRKPGVISHATSTSPPRAGGAGGAGAEAAGEKGGQLLEGFPCQTRKVRL